VVVKKIEGCRLEAIISGKTRHLRRFKDYCLSVFGAKMTSTFKPRSLTRSIMSLFGTKKGVNPHTLYPDRYYRRVFLDKQMFDGIQLVARMEKLSDRKAARLLLEKGFSKWMGEKFKEEHKIQTAARELQQKVKLTRFILELRRFARERGMDISKFI
jgi:hypothetical protein